MAAAWDIADDQLLAQLDQVWAYINGRAWICVLFQNDYVPVPGTTIDDFDLADFPGYAQQGVPDGNWDSSVVTDHVAAILNTVPVVFAADAGAWSPQTIYGYVILTEDSEYAWSERFGEARVVHPSESLTINLEYRLATYPAS